MSKKIKIYLAGPLFTLAEINDRKQQASLIRKTFKDELPNYELDLFNPIEVNDELGANAHKPNIFFYESDIKFIDQTDIAIIDIDNTDEGTMAEMGYFVALQKHVKPTLKIYILNTDWRVHKHRNEVLNKFLDGMILSHCQYFTNFTDLLNHLLIELKK